MELEYDQPTRCFII